MLNRAWCLEQSLEQSLLCWQGEAQEPVQWSVVAQTQPQCQRSQGKTTVSLLGALSEGGPRKTRMEEFSGETGNLSVFICWPKTTF